MDRPLAQTNTAGHRNTRHSLKSRRSGCAGRHADRLLAGLVWLVGLQGVADTPESVGSTLSAGERGTEVLYKWLDKAGWQVDRVSAGQTFPTRRRHPRDDQPQRRLPRGTERQCPPLD